MKLTALVTIFGLVATAAANPLPDAETGKLEARNCPAGIILESCLRLCSTAKCRSCCNVGCTTC
ncbi:hypothetical protein C8A05DRAFT_38030 [Staphylotrichum tortipilum]|uniref:Uncharacterized protein n=1 Tax=Staphylotrichum tortipilum TaxID=2831512 RepID=A0AAN6RP93_9PEZI|nr:hypothetical protein C8A05DRAFT_38030 [Staphylotrichum longicolle]